MYRPQRTDQGDRGVVALELVLAIPLVLALIIGVPLFLVDSRNVGPDIAQSFSQWRRKKAQEVEHREVVRRLEQEHVEAVDRALNQPFSLPDGCELLVRGADDSFTGHTTARLRSLLRRVDVVTLPGGHLPHVTSSLAFARAARDFVLSSGGRGKVS